jgi:hypothetical protein
MEELRQPDHPPESAMAEKITKQEAVRRALAHLGNDAKPAQMKGWIKDELGIEMGADHISTAKGSILRAAGRGRPSKKKPGRPPSAAPKTEPTPVSQARPAPGGRGEKVPGIPLNDILYVKDLVGRFGPAQLYTLIDALK